jgi:enamine deaminase RidA (YjgF/YER057c/UK114 family)
MRFLICLTLFVAPFAAQAQRPPAERFINPPGLTRPTGYTHVVVGPDDRTIYIAGQVAFDSTGQVVGAGDFRAQAEQVFANLGRALRSVGGNFADLVKTTTYLTDLSQLAVVREIRSRYLDANYPPANTLLQVAGLARPEFKIEIEAVAVLQQAAGNRVQGTSGAKPPPDP